MKRIKTKVSAFVFPLEIDSTTLKQKKKGTHNAIYCQEESKKVTKKIINVKKIKTLTCNINLSKNRTDTKQLEADNTSIISKFKKPRGKDICTKIGGHGTLSKTFGMLAKTCMKDSNIFICPNRLIFLLAFLFIIVILLVFLFEPHNRKLKKNYFF